MFRRAFKVKKILGLVIAISLLFSTPVLATENTLPEVRALLQNQYVDPVSSEVLMAPSIEEMLKKLGDPYTHYFSAVQYQDFINSMDMTFHGIGVYIELVPEGLQVSAVTENSPASEVGLQKGDIITEADGQALAGLPQETAVGLLRGPDGTSVHITVQRGGVTLKFEVVRRAISIPTVEGELVQNDIGYIALHSFGETTPAGFDQLVKELKGEGAKAWIIDLRDNPGGYLTSALNLAGYFIGEQTALQTKDRNGVFVKYPGVKQEVTLSEPTIFLANENSASASEILTSVVKDYDKAMILGNKTYGKGSVQSMFPLSDGSVLKMTIAKFYSPYGKEINGVGINPDIKIADSDPYKAAELLLASRLASDENTGGEGRVQILADDKSWDISLEKARTPDYWQAYGGLVKTVDSANLQKGSGQGWTTVSDPEKTALWPLYYPNYHELKGLQEVPLDKKFTVTFTGPINWQTVTAESLELIEKDTGKRVPLEFNPLSDSQLQVIPTNLLQAGKTYWLVTHRTIQGTKGDTLKEGALSVIQTVASEGAPLKVQATRPKKSLSELAPLPDYGQAIMDINY